MCTLYTAKSARRDRKERDRIIKSMREPSPPVLEVKVQAIQPYSTVTFKDIDSNKKNDKTKEGKSSKTWNSAYYSSVATILLKCVTILSI